MAGRPPPNFKTDVHRNPTKKWAAAPAYSYAGDDWGGYDEFGEYGSYDEPPPPPKPTGLRQRGQALPAVDTSRSASASASSATKTAPPQSNRPGSFDYGDDRRTFSAGSQQPGARYSPARAEASSPRLAQGLRKPSQDGYSPERSRYSPNQVPDYSSGSSGLRQPSPPKTELPAEDTRATPQQSQNPPITNIPAPPPTKSTFSPQPQSPYNTAETPPIAQFPPRKESLRQARPPRFQNNQPSTAPPLTSGGAHDSFSSQEEESASDAQLVRPADIYRRMEEEREKERQSSESARPSMESINRAGADASSTSTSRGLGKDSLVGGGLSAPLSTVPERKSEYGMDGFAVSNPALAQAIGASVSSTDHSRPAPPIGASAPSTDQPRPAPSLPEFRMSGFGDDFWSPDASERQQRGAEPSSGALPNPTTTAAPAEPTSDRQPSTGFRSAVENAFDRDDVTSPRDDSQSLGLGSDLSRDSSTKDISPIMNQPYSTSNMTGLGERVVDQPPTIAEERESISSDSRPTSSSTLRGAAAPNTSYSRELSGTSGTSMPSTSRREFASGSRENSPARGIEIQTEQPVPQETTGEIGLATPASTSTGDLAERTSRNSTFGADPSRSSVLQEPSTDSPLPSQSANLESPASISGAKTPVPEPLAKLTSNEQSRTSSPSKSRVRNLANKYDEIHDSRSGSPIGSISSRSARSRRDTEGGVSSREYSPERDSTNNMDAGNPATLGLPRPQLPGAWVSYANSERSMTPDGSRHEDDRPVSEDTPRASYNKKQDVASRPESDIPDFAPTNTRGSSNVTENPLAALQAAGSAIGASLMSSVPGQSSTRDFASRDTDSYESSDDNQAAEEPTRSRPGYLHSGPLRSEQIATSSGSSVAPTPPAKDTPIAEGASSDRSADYFPIAPPAPLKQRRLSHLATDQANSETQPAADLPSSSSQPHMSLDSSPEDTENDRLRKDIFHTLNSPTDGSFPQSSLSATNATQSTSLAPPSPNHDATRESTASTILPREYDSYWASTGQRLESRDNPSNFSVSSQPQATETSGNSQGQAVQREAATKPALDRRFSWEEEESEDEPQPESSLAQQSFNPSIESHETRSRDSPMRDSAEEQDDPDRERSSAATVDPMASGRSTPETKLRQASTDAYQVPDINFGDDAPLNSNPVRTDDLPQTSATGGVPSVESERDSRSISQEPIGLSEEQEIGSPAQLAPKDDYVMSHLSQTGPQPKLIPFHDIVSMKSYDQRLGTFNNTRDEFAQLDTGLGSWLTYMVAAHPEHAQTISPNVKPMVDTGFAASMRSKISPGMAKITRSGPSFGTSGSSQPYYQQYLKSAGDLPSMTGGQTSSSPSQQERPQLGSSSGQQPKGKDFFHSAGSFGGKATTSAKGLFAKGKSRFKGGTEKDRSVSAPAGVYSDPVSFSSPEHSSQADTDATPVAQSRALPSEREEKSFSASDDASKVREQYRRSGLLSFEQGVTQATASYSGDSLAYTDTSNRNESGHDHADGRDTYTQDHHGSSTTSHHQPQWSDTAPTPFDAGSQGALNGPPRSKTANMYSTDNLSSTLSAGRDTSSATTTLPHGQPYNVVSLPVEPPPPSPKSPQRGSTPSLDINSSNKPSLGSDEAHVRNEIVPSTEGQSMLASPVQRTSQVPERSAGRSLGGTNSDEPQSTIHPLFRSSMDGRSQPAVQSRRSDYKGMTVDTSMVPPESVSSRASVTSPNLVRSPISAPAPPTNVDSLPPSIRNRYKRHSQSSLFRDSEGPHHQMSGALPPTPVVPSSYRASSTGSPASDANMISRGPATYDHERLRLPLKQSMEHVRIEGDAQQQPRQSTSKTGGMSPWRRFRARSRTQLSERDDDAYIGRTSSVPQSVPQMSQPLTQPLGMMGGEDDAPQRAQQSEKKSRGTSPWKKLRARSRSRTRLSESEDNLGRSQQFAMPYNSSQRPEPQGQSEEYVRRENYTQQQLQQPTNKERGMSPWRRFGARSRRPSGGDDTYDEAQRSSMPPDVLHKAETKEPRKRSISPWARFRSRSGSRTRDSMTETPPTRTYSDPPVPPMPQTTSSQYEPSAAEIARMSRGAGESGRYPMPGDNLAGGDSRDPARIGERSGDPQALGPRSQALGTNEDERQLGDQYGARTFHEQNRAQGRQSTSSARTPDTHAHGIANSRHQRNVSGVTDPASEQYHSARQSLEQNPISNARRSGDTRPSFASGARPAPVDETPEIARHQDISHARQSMDSLTYRNNMRNTSDTHSQANQGSTRFPSLDVGRASTQQDRNITSSSVVAQHPGDTPIDGTVDRPRRQSTNRQVDPMTAALSQPMSTYQNQQPQDPETPQDPQPSSDPSASPPLAQSTPEDSKRSPPPTSYRPTSSKRRSWISSIFSSNASTAVAKSDQSGPPSRASPMAPSSPAAASPAVRSPMGGASPRAVASPQAVASPRASSPSAEPSSIQPRKHGRRRRSSASKPPIEAGQSSGDWSASLQQSIIGVSHQQSTKTRPKSWAFDNRNQSAAQNAPGKRPTHDRESHLAYLHDSDVFPTRPRSTVYEDQPTLQRLEGAPPNNQDPEPFRGNRTQDGSYYPAPQVDHDAIHSPEEQEEIPPVPRMPSTYQSDSFRRSTPTPVAPSMPPHPRSTRATQPLTNTAYARHPTPHQPPLQTNLPPSQSRASAPPTTHPQPFTNTQTRPKSPPSTNTQLSPTTSFYKYSTRNSGELDEDRPPAPYVPWLSTLQSQKQQRLHYDPLTDSASPIRQGPWNAQLTEYGHARPYEFDYGVTLPWEPLKDAVGGEGGRMQQGGMPEERGYEQGRYEGAMQARASQEVRSQEARSQEMRGQEAQSQEAQSQEAQSQEAQSQEMQSPLSRGQEIRSRYEQGYQQQTQRQGQRPSSSGASATYPQAPPPAASSSAPTSGAPASGHQQQQQPQKRMRAMLPTGMEEG